jgi:hypothetical protein
MGKRKRTLYVAQTKQLFDDQQGSQKQHTTTNNKSSKLYLIRAGVGLEHTMGSLRGTGSGKDRNGRTTTPREPVRTYQFFPSAIRISYPCRKSRAFFFLIEHPTPYPNLAQIGLFHHLLLYIIEDVRPVYAVAAINARLVNGLEVFYKLI